MADLIRLQDFQFLIHDLLHVETLCESPRFSEYGREIFDETLSVSKQIAEGVFEKRAAIIDQNPPELVDGQIHTPPELKESIDAFRDAGLLAAPFDEKWGGSGLPYVISQAITAIFAAADVSTTTYLGLTVAAANLIAAHGSNEQKEHYLKPMVEGRFFGTMCLSEPHAGSSLTDILTVARPREDGTYAIQGTKMWISGADHELSDNIVHLVLAKLPDAPGGTRGISLFIVPKIHVTEGPRKGQRNDVHVAGLNHKMGQRGNSNALLALGDNGECIGHMVGEPNRGLQYMFHMMNEARTGTGLVSAAVGYAGLRYSLAYAKERPQGRHPGVRDGKPIMIIEHTDVRRMLLAQKAYVEGSLHLAFYCAMLIDRMHVAQTAGDEQKANALDTLLALLTPITKAWPSEYCLDANRLAIQVHGGYGYTLEYPVERLYRDNRLNAIVEGTNGIQALDLLGRKIPMGNGAALRALKSEIDASIATAAEIPALETFATQLRETVALVIETTMKLGALAMQGQTDLYLANATAYLHLLGHTVLGWLWLDQMRVAWHKNQIQEQDFLLGKLQTGQYFFRHELPRTKEWATLLQKGDATCLEMKEAWF